METKVTFLINSSLRVQVHVTSYNKCSYSRSYSQRPKFKPECDRHTETCPMNWKDKDKKGVRFSPFYYPIYNEFIDTFNFLYYL